MSIRLLVLTLATCLAAGCYTAMPKGPLKLKPRFDRSGVYDPNVKATPIVASPDDVKIFYGTSPPGFTLKENELAVEASFSHQILGTIKVEYVEGFCFKGGGTKADVIHYMQRAAFENGGNAVIYAHSALPDVQPKQDEVCKPYDEQNFGTGWVVVLKDPALGAAPAPAAP